MGKKKKRPPQGGGAAARPEPLENAPEISNVVSAGECTGLFPALPEDEAALLNQRRLFSMEIPDK